MAIPLPISVIKGCINRWNFTTELIALNQAFGHGSAYFLIIARLPSRRPRQTFSKTRPLRPFTRAW